MASASIFAQRHRGARQAGHGLDIIRPLGQRGGERRLGLARAGVAQPGAGRRVAQARAERGIVLQSVDGQRAGLGLAGIHQVLRAQALRRGVVFIGPFGDRRVLHVLRRGFLDALQELLGILVAAAVHIGEEQRLLGRDAVDVARAGLGQRLFVADDRLVVAFLVRVGVAGRNQHVGVHRRIGGAQPLVQLDGVRVAAAQAQAVDHVADHRRAQRRILAPAAGCRAVASHRPAPRPASRNARVRSGSRFRRATSAGAGRSRHAAAAHIPAA